jgi:hypothetical protein
VIDFDVSPSCRAALLVRYPFATMTRSKQSGVRQAQSRHQTPWHQMKIVRLFSISRIGDIIQKGKNTP